MSAGPGMSSEGGAEGRYPFASDRADEQLELDLGLGPKRPTSVPVAGFDRLLAADDLHPAWLEELRLLSASRAPGLDRPGLMAEASARIRDLRRHLVDTPAQSRAGVLAQAELICDLAWNEVVAAAARQVVSGIKRLWLPA